MSYVHRNRVPSANYARNGAMNARNGDTGIPDPFYLRRIISSNSRAAAKISPLLSAADTAIQSKTDGALLNVETSTRGKKMGRHEIAG
jgi:hypothetical protein